MRSYLGFEPENETASSINSKIERLIAMSPSDSDENTSIEKHGELFTGEIKLISSQGVFLARSVEKNLAKLTSTITQSIENQLRRWRASRGLETPDSTSNESKKEKINNPDFSSKSILIIDDDHDSVRILEMALQKLGCYAHFVSDGKKAAAEISKSNFDLIILDWFMPSVNGGDTLAKAESLIASSKLVQGRGLEKSIPVIIYSAHEVGSFDKFPECEFFTFVDIWKKQFNFNQLSTRLAQILPNL